MGVLWFKVWSDLWHNKTRTLLAVLSIGTGIFAVGAMFGLGDMMSTTMNASHVAVQPPHINVILAAPAAGEVLQGLEEIPGVAGVEPYNSVTVTYKRKPEDAWRQAIFHMRGDYDAQKYELLELREGDWPRGKADLGVERMAAQALNLKVGDRVIFKIGDKERTLEITSLIRHPFVPPLQFQDLAFFFTEAQALERFDIPVGTYNSFFVRVTPYSADYAKEVANAIKAKLARQNLRVLGFAYQDPARHWGRDMMDGFTMVIEMLAVITLAMGAVLIYNTLGSLIRQQTNQIGILKAIGGTAGTIIGLYLLTTIIYGVLGLAVALPAGAIVAYGTTQGFLNLFNIDFAQFAFSRSAITFQIGSGLVVPLVAGLPPVLAGARTTVRQAIASYGLGSDRASGWLDRLVEGIGRRWLSAPYATALGNLFRHRGRLLMTQIVLIGAGSSFLTVMSLNSSIQATLDNLYSRRKFDLLIAFDQAERAGRVEAMTNSVAGVEASELRMVQSASLLVEGQLVREAGLSTSIEGMPAGSDFFRPLMVSGRWFEPGEGKAIVLTRDAAEKNGIEVGDTVILDLGELGRDDWVVVGTYEPVFVGTFSSDTIYAPLDALAHATKKFNQGTLLFVRTSDHSPDSQAAVTQILKDRFELHGVRVFQSQTISQQRATNEFSFSITVTMMLLLSVIVAVVGGIALMGALSIGVIERTKEIGVLRAVGARNRTILGIFMMEGLLQGWLSWLVATPISLAASPFVASALGLTMFGARLDHAYNLPAVAAWLGIVTVISIVASIVPARRATRISVRDSLAYA